MEKHLRDALIALKAAQDEILFPCELYSQLEDMQFAVEAIIAGKNTIYKPTLIKENNHVKTIRHNQIIGFRDCQAGKK